MRLITHNGKPHADEVLACAFSILAEARRCKMPIDGLPFEILRVRSLADVPGDIGLDDWVIDIGELHDPEFHRFDHHGIPSLENECAATLVAKALLPEILQDYHWGKSLERVMVNDTRGKAGLEEKYGPDATKRLHFVEDGLIQHFPNDPVGVARMLAHLTENRLQFVQDKRRAVEWLARDENHSILLEKGVLVLEVLNDPATAGFSIEIAEAAQGRMTHKHGIEMVYGWGGDRNPGSRSLFRTEFAQAGKIDLFRARPQQERYRDLRGFLLAFDPIHPLEWQRLLGESVID